MKYINKISTIGFSIALLATAAQAKEPSHDSSHMGASLENIHRINEDAMDMRTTAKDLIGTDVYDMEGEKIGTIADIGLSNLAHLDGMKKSHSKKGMDDEKETPYASKDHMKPGPKSEATLFLSVGGLLGIGDDIVEIPASSISFDSELEQYTLNVSKAQIVALAEQEPMMEKKKWDTDSQYSAKQVFESDAIAIRNALQINENQKENAGIMVDEEDDKIILYGTVLSAAAKRNAEKIASEFTDLKISNEIEVQKNDQ